MSFFSFSQDYRGVADVFLRDPDRYGPLLDFLEGVMVEPSELSKIQREVLAAVVSTANGCGFCVGAHKATLLALGAEPELVEAVDGEIEAIPTDAAFLGLLRFAAKLTREPSGIERRDVDRVLASGWSEAALEDAINVVAVFNYVNRLVDAFGLEGEAAYFRHIGTALARHGYAPLLRGRRSAGAS